MIYELSKKYNKIPKYYQTLVSTIIIYEAKDINYQYLCKVYCRARGQYLIQFDAIEKSVMGLQIRSFKNCNKWTPVDKHCWRWKVYILNKCSCSSSTIEKQFNQDTNTLTHLKLYKDSFDLLVYHDLQLKFLSSIVG